MLDIVNITKNSYLCSIFNLNTMLRNIFTLVVCVLATILTTSAQTPPNNEIWYTTTDECKISITNLDDVASHAYVNGKGVIKFNNSVTEIGFVAFEGCTSLTSVTIPDSVTWIGKGAFSGCTSLTSINIPNSVTQIGEYAFSGCTSLTSINIPNSVTQIEDYAFYGCTSLKSINIPDSVTNIEDGTFAGCTSLTSITIPNSVTKIGGGAFAGCTSLKSFKSKFASADGRCLIKDGVLLAFAPAGLTSYTIPYGVTQIGFWAFYGCTSLTNITIPDSVTEIRGWAFHGCTSLTSITIPDSVTEIGWGAFEGCTSLPIINKIRYADTYLVEAVDKSLTSYPIKAGTRFIGNDAFDGCTSLTSITIPDSVTQIGWGAFPDCTSLTSITIPDSVTQIGHWAFSGCTSLTSITIPNSRIEIEDDAFEGCNIEQITISAVTGNIFRGCDGLDPSKVVAYTGKYASEDGRCLIKDGVLIDFILGNLTSYAIPEGVKVINPEVFSNCYILTDITIPATVTQIGDNLFAGGSPELSITCLSTTPPQISSLGISEKATIYVPEKSVNAYKKAEGWINYKKQIKCTKVEE